MKIETDNRYCVILNGPPGVGKDTIAKLLVEAHGFVQCENKTPLHKLGAALTGISEAEWARYYNNRELKESPTSILGGMSPRELYIWLSESVIKPKFGADWFGHMSVRCAKMSASNVVFSDGGFQPEYEALQAGFGVEKVLLVHLFRDGFSFDGDSRNYLKPNGSPYLPEELIDGSPEVALRNIMGRLNTMGWRS